MFKVSNKIINFEHISHLFSSVSTVDFEQVNVSCPMLPPHLKINSSSHFQLLTDKLFYLVLFWASLNNKIETNRHIQNPVKHLRWSVLKPLNIFEKCAIIDARQGSKYPYETNL